MKKILIITAIIISVALCSCQLDLLGSGSGAYDITLKNNCAFAIDVNISPSKSEPSSFLALSKGGSLKFSSVKDGYYYVHIKSSTTGTEDFVTQNAIRVNKTETWTITYDATNKFSVQGILSSSVSP